jgi:uncharacterized protein (DUF488 family)
MELYTIGHSAHPIAHFLGLLQMHQIEVLADVRSIPASRFHPQYNQKRLAGSLAEAGIAYYSLGDRLGGRPGDPVLYPNGQRRHTPGERFPRPDFSLVMQQPWFVAGIADLLAICTNGQTAILCSEEDPSRCHRRLLIAAYLSAHSPEVRVFHIRGDGKIEQD